MQILTQQSFKPTKPARFQVVATRYNWMCLRDNELCIEYSIEFAHKSDRVNLSIMARSDKPEDRATIQFWLNRAGAV